MFKKLQRLVVHWEVWANNPEKDMMVRTESNVFQEEMRNISEAVY